jgi:hypothetical protein
MGNVLWFNQTVVLTINHVRSEPDKGNEAEGKSMSKWHISNLVQKAGTQDQTAALGRQDNEADSLAEPHSQQPAISH